jgi:hypothetical protein
MGWRSLFLLRQMNGSVIVRVILGLLLAVVAAGATAGGADASGRGCRSVSADNPMVSSGSFGVAKCHVRGARYFTRSYLGEGARGYAARASSDPMVWSDSRWRGTLFDGYTRTYNDAYDRRFRRAGPDQVRVHRDVRVIVRTGPAVEAIDTVPAKPRRARLINMRTRADAERYLENSSKFSGHRCSGILVLTWKAGGARSRCYEGKGRIRTQ